MNTRQALQEASMRTEPLNGGTHGFFAVQQRKQMCVGKGSADGFETLLAAAHAREPIVYQDHARASLPSHRRSPPLPAPMSGRRVYTKTQTADKPDVAGVSILQERFEVFLAERANEVTPQRPFALRLGGLVDHAG